jgi:phospholipid transport system substrate-binding protein
MTRRTLLAVSAAAAFLAVSGLRPVVAASSAATTVKDFADQLVAIVNSSQPAAEKKAALQPVIDRYVDVGQIARFCLGRFWQTASAAQQQHYVAIFHKKLLNSISGHLGDYTGVSYTMSGETQKGDTTLVGTAIVRPNAPTANVQWVVDGAGKVVDVVAEGTSLRLTERQDYASFLGQHGGSIDALLSALQRQIDAAG